MASSLGAARTWFINTRARSWLPTCLIPVAGLVAGPTSEFCAPGVLARYGQRCPQPGQPAPCHRVRRPPAAIVPGVPPWPASRQFH